MNISFSSLVLYFMLGFIIGKTIAEFLVDWSRNK